MELPRIRIVAPSLNQAGYLHEMRESILGQVCQNVAYVIVDATVIGTLCGSVWSMARCAMKVDDTEYPIMVNLHEEDLCVNAYR
jgi:hypothetical protein